MKYRFTKGDVSESMHKDGSLSKYKVLNAGSSRRFLKEIGFLYPKKSGIAERNTGIDSRESELNKRFPLEGAGKG